MLEAKVPKGIRNLLENNKEMHNMVSASVVSIVKVKNHNLT